MHFVDILNQQTFWHYLLSSLLPICWTLNCFVEDIWLNEMPYVGSVCTKILCHSKFKCPKYYSTATNFEVLTTCFKQSQHLIPSENMAKIIPNITDGDRQLAKKQYAPDYLIQLHKKIVHILKKQCFQRLVCRFVFQNFHFTRFHHSQKVFNKKIFSFIQHRILISYIIKSFCLMHISGPQSIRNND